MIFPDPEKLPSRKKFGDWMRGEAHKDGGLIYPTLFTRGPAWGTPPCKSVRKEGGMGTPRDLWGGAVHPIRDLFSDSGIFSGFRENVRIGENRGNLCNSQSRRFEPPRRCRSQHSNPGGARCLSSASVAQMLAAASIKVMDALFGLVARNDAEWTR